MSLCIKGIGSDDIEAGSVHECPQFEIQLQPYSLSECNA